MGRSDGIHEVAMRVHWMILRKPDTFTFVVLPPQNKLAHAITVTRDMVEINFNASMSNCGLEMAAPPDLAREDVRALMISPLEE
jgi:hypothetical protein